MDTINVVNSTENNLKGVSVRLPKKKITVFTGISGSGKSSLCLDTIAAQSRRELNETFPSFVQQYLPKYGRPHVDRIENLPVTIVIDQKKPAGNSRSTVGTYTDIYALLRLLFSRVGTPFVGYSDSFSFNHPVGRCPRCDGLGEVTELDVHKLVDFDKCLNDEGVINFPAFTTGAWRWKRYAYSGLFDLDKKIKDYSKEELDLFLYSPQIKLKNPPSNWPKSAKFEGIYPRMYRSIITQKEGVHHKKYLEKMVSTFTCPVCGGARLNEKVLSCRINGKNIAEVTAMPIPEAYDFIVGIKDPLAADLVPEITNRLGALIKIGLGYLSLSRGMNTVSGGEAQRIKIAKYINSSLTDMAYVLDEPSSGLHSQDIRRMQESLLKLRDHGNTVLMVEHHKEIISMADHIVDMGPLAGENGGQIVFEGSYSELIKSGTVTGDIIRARAPWKAQTRKPTGFIPIEIDDYHNLRDFKAQMPLGVLCAVIGVAGSGKSSLMESFISRCGKKTVFIGQKNIGINLRSTPATYLGISDVLRDLFAKHNKVSRSLFTFNGEGACPACGGKGVIVSDMAFMESIETVCPECGGSRYSKKALSYKYRGRSIADILGMTVDAAEEILKDLPISERLRDLKRVGLGYLHLDQSMTTLSGGELQRVKLADHLNEKGEIMILDEPTDGLHPEDVKTLQKLMDELTDAGNSLFVIEHNLDVMRRSDWLIELGPEGGMNGGKLLFSGPPREIKDCTSSVTRDYLFEEDEA